MSAEVFPHCIVIQYSDAEINTLAESLGLECVDEQAQLPDSGFVLRWGDEGLALQQLGKKAPNPVRVDFTSGAVDHRRKFGGGSGQMIAKAVGVKVSRPLRILDATAGLGRDAFVLASLGCHLQLHERNPVVHALLADGLRRALRSHDNGLVDIVGRMQLLACDSLSAQVPDTDVVYLDPMFPERSKSASVKKDMAIFHSIVGGDEDADGLLQQALEAAKYRVVVKRPKKAPFLNQQAPSYQLTGKASRYDIYVNAKLP